MSDHDGGSSVQMKTIQTLGRITECISRLSRTVGAMSHMEMLLYHPTPSLKNCDGRECGDLVEQLFDGIQHSVNHMELLALSVEQRFEHVERLMGHLDKSIESSACSSPRVSSSDNDEGFHVYSAINDGDKRDKHNILEPLMKTRSVDKDKLLNVTTIMAQPRIEFCDEHSDPELERDLVINDYPSKNHLERRREVKINQNNILDLPQSSTAKTKERISLLEDRLTSWINEIDDIDVRIERSLKTSKSIME